MRILVFGGSGKTGREVLRQAIERRHAVTAFVRTPSKIADVSGVRIVQGDVSDAAGIAAALSDHDAVVSTLGVGKPLKHDPVVVAGIGHIVRAMEARGPRRLIYMSFIGVRESRSAVGFLLRYVAPIPLRHEIADHESKERIVKGSALDWTIVRPPTLTNGPGTGRYRRGEDITNRAPVSFLSRADVAHFMLDELEKPAFVRGTPRILP